MVTGYNRAKLELIINLGPIHFTSDTQPHFLQLKHYTGYLLGEEGLQGITKANGQLGDILTVKIDKVKSERLFGYITSQQAITSKQGSNGDLPEDYKALSGEVSISGESYSTDKRDKAPSNQRLIVFPSEILTRALRGLDEGLTRRFTARNDIVTRRSDKLVLKLINKSTQGWITYQQVNRRR